MDVTRFINRRVQITTSSLSYMLRSYPMLYFPRAVKINFCPLRITLGIEKYFYSWVIYIPFFAIHICNNRLLTKEDREKDKELDNLIHQYCSTLEFSALDNFKKFIAGMETDLGVIEAVNNDYSLGSMVIPNRDDPTVVASIYLKFNLDPNHMKYETYKHLMDAIEENREYHRKNKTGA